MPGPVTSKYIDQLLEQEAFRKSGMLGRGRSMGNALFAIDYLLLPPEARKTIESIIRGGPYHSPKKDGKRFGNNFGDLPSGEYLEYTVPTPGITDRCVRRIVARKTTGQLFFTACHYERIHVTGGTPTAKAEARLKATAGVDEEWRNGFYVITGMSIDLRNQIKDAIKLVS